MKQNLFQQYPAAYSEIDRMYGDVDSLAIQRASTFDPHKHMLQQLAAETERWVRMALEKGPGWDVWRSEPRTAEGDHFVLVFEYALVPPGGSPPGTGMLFTQPELTPGERVRLLANRHDWREDRWEDECGVPDCGHSCCDNYRAGRP